MIVDLTIAIPTYNGAGRLPEVLEQLRISCMVAALRQAQCPQRRSLVAELVGEHLDRLDVSPVEPCRSKDALHASTHTKQFLWEVLVIDNNSTDDTAKVVQAYQADWPNEYPLRYCLEPKQGAAFARHRAIKEARGALVGFLDDDNIPAPDWAVAACTFAQDYPAAGAFSSRIHAVYDVTPPENFERLAPFLAITDRGLEPLPYERHKKVLPPSAGLVVRKQAWLDSVPAQQVLTGRTKNSMLTSEDLEMLSHIQANGWEIWYNPAMQIDHKIPHWRLKRDYLIPFFRGIGLSRHVTRMLSVQPWQRPIAFVAYLLNDVRKITFHLLKHGTRVQSDLIAACEMELYVSSLVSPFYLWSNGYLDINEQPDLRSSAVSNN